MSEKHLGKKKSYGWGELENCITDVCKNVTVFSLFYVAFNALDQEFNAVTRNNSTAWKNSEIFKILHAKQVIQNKLLERHNDYQ